MQFDKPKKKNKSKKRIPLPDKTEHVETPKTRYTRKEKHRLPFEEEENGCFIGLRW